MTTTRPENVGILAMEMYSPSRFVSQEDLEIVDNCKGKYVIGLGQLNMAFCDDYEDINSIFLTVTVNLLEKYSIDVSKIGRVEVGTETLVDKSKSSKTSLLSLFGENTDIEGITSVNACYGGTAALFNSIAWVESSEWDGRYALVVCGDIAVYEAGPARPTGGCCAIAILIGPDAPLVLEPGVRATHCLDVYDFYKPKHSEYPLVDGRLSQRAYLSSVDICYTRYKNKTARRFPHQPPVTADYFDYFAFHSPYNKLVQKGYGRLLYIDSQDPTYQNKDVIQALEPLKEVTQEESYEHKDIDTVLKNVSSARFQATVLPGCAISRNVGNCYTASVFTCLLSILAEHGAGLIGKRVGVFSFGSGSVASLYSFVGRDTSSSSHGHSLATIQSIGGQILNRLADRKKCSVEEFSHALSARERSFGRAPLVPEGDLTAIAPGTYHLTSIDDKCRRSYSRLAIV